MADPFSILASGVGIADVAVRVIGYLKDVKAAAETVEDDIDSLISEVEALRVVHANVELEFKRHAQNKSLSANENILWFHTGKTLKEGQKLTAKLEQCVREIYGSDPKVSGKRDGLIKQNRKRARQTQLSELHEQIHTQHVRELIGKRPPGIRDSCLCLRCSVCPSLRFADLRYVQSCACH